MPVLSFLMAWTGYSLLTWGVATVRGCNVTFTQVAWPGKFVGCNPDQGGTVGSIPGQAGLNTKNQNTIAQHNAIPGAPQIVPGQRPNPVTTNGSGRGTLSGGNTKGPPTAGLG